MTTFVDERLDVNIEKGAKGGPTFLTTVIELANSYEQRNQEWLYARQSWDIAYGIQDPAEFQQVVKMFYACRGRAYGFRFQDWSDYSVGDPFDYVIADAQTIGTGNAMNTQFQIFKRYYSPQETTYYDRPITRPQSTSPSTMAVYLNGVEKTEGTDYTVDYDTGLITFTTYPGNGVVVSVSCFFDVPVRFDSDEFIQNLEWTGAIELPSIKILELKEFAGVV